MLSKSVVLMSEGVGGFFSAFNPNAFKSQAGIEALTMFSLLILFFIMAFLIYLNEKSIAERQAGFAQAQQVVQETALLLNSGSRIDGFYAEFQVPIILPSFSLNLSNYSVTGLIQVNGQNTQISYPLNATIYCSPCVLSQGVYWASTSNRVTRVGQKS